MLGIEVYGEVVLFLKGLKCNFKKDMKKFMIKKV